MIDYKELDEMIDNTWRIEDDLASIGVTREQALKLADDYIAEITALYNKHGIEKRQKAIMLEDICVKNNDNFFFQILYKLIIFNNGRIRII